MRPCEGALFTRASSLVVLLCLHLCIDVGVAARGGARLLSGLGCSLVSVFVKFLVRFCFFWGSVKKIRFSFEIVFLGFCESALDRVFGSWDRLFGVGPVRLAEPSRS